MAANPVIGFELNRVLSATNRNTKFKAPKGTGRGKGFNVSI